MANQFRDLESTITKDYSARKKPIWKIVLMYILLAIFIYGLVFLAINSIDWSSLNTTTK